MLQPTRQRVLPLVILVLLVTALGGLGAAPPNGQNDAGSGRDAGDQMESALVLPHEGRFMGNMSPSASDRDWFAPPPLLGSGPTCTEADVRASPGTYVALARGGDDPRVFRTVTNHGFQHLAFAFDAAPGYLAVRPGPSPNQPIDPYAFDVTTRVHADLPMPAPGTDAATAPTIPRGCLAGSHSGVAQYFAVNVKAGRHLTIAFADADAGLTVAVLDHAGTRVGTLAGGDLATFSIGASGTWHLVVQGGGSAGGGATSQASLGVDGPVATLSTTSDDDTDYTMSTSDSDDPPTTNGCRPTCSSTLIIE